MKSTLVILFRISTTVLAWGFGACVLRRYEYFIAFSEIDNIVGMIPVALVLTGATGTTILIWARHSIRFIPVSITIAILVALSIALFPTALRGNWWINPSTSSETQAAPDLALYAPFEGPLIARLNEEPELKLVANLPALDGATALYPVYAAFAEAVYDENAYAPGSVICTNTVNAYRAIISGESDVIFVAGASEQQLSAAREAGADLVFTPIGREAFIFLVGDKNPVQSVTQQQIRNIYSGKTANWRTLGWREGGRIIAFQRPDGSGSQTGLQGIMGELPIQVPQPLPDASLIGTNSLMNQVSVEWQGVQPAMGYSYRYFAVAMYANPNARLLKIDGIEPTIENIQNGSYPFVADFYAVTNGEPSGNKKLLIDWILSPQGQNIVEKTGYAPIKSTTTPASE